MMNHNAIMSIPKILVAGLKVSLRKQEKEAKIRSASMLSDSSGGRCKRERTRDSGMLFAITLRRSR